MKLFLAITKALSDENRVRALIALKAGEMCVCQVIELLGLSPSTMSKHMDILYQAGLVQRRKKGKWAYYRLASTEATPVVRQALKWALGALCDERVIQDDARRCCSVKKMDLEEVSACYREK